MLLNHFPKDRPRSSRFIIIIIIIIIIITIIITIIYFFHLIKVVYRKFRK